MLKYLFLGIVLAFVYFAFFRKKIDGNEKIEKKDSEEMVECAKCGTYLSVKEGLIKYGKFYCSKNCMGE